MSALEQQIFDYIKGLRGTAHEDAYRRLIELGPRVIPSIATHFRQEHDPAVRATLVRVAWRTKSSDAISLMAEALNDAEPAVWKEALDGLVSLGGRDALEVIREAQRRAPERAEWLDEAAKQIAESR